MADNLTTEKESCSDENFGCLLMARYPTASVESTYKLLLNYERYQGILQADTGNVSCPHKSILVFRKYQVYKDLSSSVFW